MLADVFTWQAAVNSILSGVSIVTLVIFAVYFGRYSERVDTMWKAFLLNGISQANSRGLMAIHSPARLVNGSGEKLCKMKDELREFYEKNCKGKSEQDAAMLIQKQFGDRLAAEICIPNHWSINTGIVIALAVAKGGALTEILDHSLPLLGE